MTGRRLALGLAVTLGLALSAAGCSPAPDPADASAPLLVHGVVHDYAEQPVASARVTVSVNGPVEAGEEYGDVGGESLLQMDVTSDAAGRFSIRLAPTDRITQAAVEMDGLVGFTLVVRVPDPDQIGGSWTFTRTIAGGSWAGEAPGVVLRPVNSGTEGCC